MTIGTVSLPFACGFEMGSSDLVPADQTDGVNSADNTYVKTGTYSVKLGGGIEWKLSSTRSNLYMSAWVRVGSDSYGQLRVDLVSEENLYVEYDNDDEVMKAYVDSVLVATGTVSVANDTWFHVEAYFSIANVGGEIKTWIDGIADIDYTGDTQPSASDQIESFQIRNRLNVSFWVDDLHAATSRIYDRRVLAAVPTSDNTAQLTASGGGDNYADVDEVPPDDDTTYVYTDTDAQKDLYGHGGVDLTDYTTPFWLAVWARGRKTVANGDQLRLLLSSNGTEDQGDFEDLLTTWAGYIQKVWVNDPDTAAAWANEAAIDAVLIGIESNIP